MITCNLPLSRLLCSNADMACFVKLERSNAGNLLSRLSAVSLGPP